jgi:DNA-binding response OmpR family regulator
MNVEGEADTLGWEDRVPSVLLCDDSHTEREALAAFLRKRGYDVFEADGGAEALKFLKSHEIELVLLDLQMPKPTGFDVLSYLQEHRKALPVILLSGMPLDDIQHKIHRLPAHELPPLFLKPVDMERLLEVVSLQLSGQMPGIPEPSGPGDAQDLPAA